MTKFPLVVLLLLALSLTHLIAATISGTVLGPDGKPVAGALVSVVLFIPLQSHALSPLNAVTDAHGVFTIEVDPTMAKQRPGCTITAYAPGLSVDQCHCMLGAQPCTLHLPPAGTVRGTVQDEQGKPVADAVVRIAFLSMPGTPRFKSVNIPAAWTDRFSVHSGLDGAWSFSGTPPGCTLMAVLDDPRFAGQRIFAQMIDDKHPIVPLLIARPAAVLSGRVLAPDGLPTENIAVTADPQNHDKNPMQWTVMTDAHGRYCFRSLDDGAYTLRAADPKERWLVQPLHDVAAVPGTEQPAPDLRLIVGAVLEGSLTDLDTGQPVPNVDVVFTRLDDAGKRAPYAIMAPGKADGAFHFRLLPGTYRIGATAKPGYAAWPEKEVTVKDRETKTLLIHLGRNIILRNQDNT